MQAREEHNGLEMAGGAGAREHPERPSRGNDAQDRAVCVAKPGLEVLSLFLPLQTEWAVWDSWLVGAVVVVGFPLRVTQVSRRKAGRGSSKAALGMLMLSFPPTWSAPRAVCLSPCPVPLRESPVARVGCGRRAAWAEGSTEGMHRRPPAAG